MTLPGTIKRSNTWIIAGTLLATVLLCLYAIPLTNPVISDETTTMANAAWLTGHDWSLMVAALGGFYYRHGQAIMTVPFFAFLKDPDMIYRLSMVLQAILQASIVPVVYMICRRHLHVKSEKIATLLGMAVCFVPSMALYVFYYRGDFLLGVFPWYVLLAFLEAMKAAENDKRGIRAMATVLAALFSVLSYAAHTRGIVVVIALVMTAVAVSVFWKRRSLYGPILFIALVLFGIVDSLTGDVLKNAVYGISGLNVNALETTDIGAYLSIFSLRMLKDIVMLCLSWLYTLIASAQGLVVIGLAAFFGIFVKMLSKRGTDISDGEKVVSTFCFLVFAGYYAVGALFFKGTYLALRTGEMERRVDRLLYDRYAICGAGMIIFLALYVISCRKEWLRLKEKVACIVVAVAVMGMWVWKILPTAGRYTGYIYNTIILNTFQEVPNPAKILSGQYYDRRALVAVGLLGIILMLVILSFSCLKKKWMVYGVLTAVLVSDLALIHVNYVKVRKASNDYVADATNEVVGFMQELEEDITEDFPYVLKGGLSGIKIQFYQSQMMEYQMFGVNQEKDLKLDDYFIISKYDDIDTTWYEEDYYLFEDFDYENAKYDIVYVKGEKLKTALEELGYKMKKYEPGDRD